MTFIICSLWLPQLDSPQAATPGKLYTVQFSFSGFHFAFALFTNSILINSQAVYNKQKADDLYHLLSLAPAVGLAASGHAGKTVHCTVFFFRLSLRFRSVHQLHLD